jgi:beta-carotene/zeaxanthin 4-ketolase
MTEYMGVVPIAVIAAQSVLYVFLLGVNITNGIIFWILPAILSSLQLFVFGTYLPHRPGPAGFDDRHNARSNDYPAWLSLLTCFHFGYHHEHHLRPGEPWWRLPAVRRSRR